MNLKNGFKYALSPRLVTRRGTFNGPRFSRTIFNNSMIQKRLNHFLPLAPQEFNLRSNPFRWRLIKFFVWKRSREYSIITTRRREDQFRREIAWIVDNPQTNYIVVWLSTKLNSGRVHTVRLEWFHRQELHRQYFYISRVPLLTNKHILLLVNNYKF